MSAIHPDHVWYDGKRYILQDPQPKKLEEVIESQATQLRTTINAGATAGQLSPGFLLDFAGNVLKFLNGDDA